MMFGMQTRRLAIGLSVTQEMGERKKTTHGYSALLAEELKSPMTATTAGGTPG
jgi:hypothetical protein